MRVVNQSDFRKNLKNNLDLVSENQEIMIINRSKNRDVVVISMKDFNSINETLHLTSTKKNKKRLDEAIEEFENNQFFRHQLIEE